VPEQNELRRIVYGAVPFEGDVAIKNPSVRYVVTSNYIPCSAVGCGSTSDTLQHIFFGREVLANTGRVFVGQDDLKRRAFLGPTSLPSELALLMANMAQVPLTPTDVRPFLKIRPLLDIGHQTLVPCDIGSCMV
jgi:tRNA (guanine10-N2)-methyltransferase